jgi:hypothetical protein
MPNDDDDWHVAFSDGPRVWVAVDSAAIVRDALKRGLLLDRLLMGICPRCHDAVFLTIDELVFVERQVGEPAFVFGKACYPDNRGSSPSGESQT